MDVRWRDELRPARDRDTNMNIRRRTRYITFVLGLLLLCIAPMASIAVTSKSASDIRILIDISGSMKQNDPQRLRAPALRLLTGLLPNGARAGVWTYGQQVNMLVPLAMVDAQWKERALEASKRINSAGLYTNIEEALTRASADWRTPDVGSDRHIIMLTDGWVDISKDPHANAASRARIVDDILPRLRDAKVKIHTIALSDGADHALLRQLSAASDGWYEKTDSADQLQRIFLRLFEKAAKPDTLPLKDNAVQVDASIEEMTFLVFREKDKNVELIAPDNKTFSAAQTNAAVHWHRDAGYDLVTVTKPQPGVWHVRGTQDSDNRVMVVTNLKVRATSLPNNLYIDDAPHYFVQLTQQGTVIRQQEFLDLVTLALELRGDQANAATATLLDDGKAPDVGAHDGTFSYRLPTPLKEGRFELNLRVDGKTFQREQRQVFNVYAQPAAATVTADPARPDHFVLAVVPHAGLIDMQTMQVGAVVTQPDGKTTELALAQSGPAEWRQEITVADTTAQYSVDFTVQGMRPDGKPINKKLQRLTFGAGGVHAAPEAEAPAPALPAEAAPQPQADAAAPADEAAAEEHINWITVAWQSLLINAVLIPLGVFGYKKWRRGQRPVVDAAIAETDAEAKT